MTPVSRDLVMGEVGMNRLRHVAEQLSDSVCGVSRLGCWLRPRVLPGLRSARFSGRFHSSGQLSQFGLGDCELEPIELLVEEADVLTVSDLESGEVCLRPEQCSAPFFADGFELA
jgi:hypothetical protein